MVEQVGRYEYTIEAWVDHFASWQHALEAASPAQQVDLDSEFLEGAALVRAAAERAPPKPSARVALTAGGRLLEREASRSGTAVGPLASARRAHGRRARPAIRHALGAGAARHRGSRARAVWRLVRDVSAFGRSRCHTRSATFREAAERLPAIAAMGFDVLYLPPIHPIGTTNRKGRGNALHCQAGRSGQSRGPSASESGGHTAVEPGLGTIDDLSGSASRQRATGWRSRWISHTRRRPTILTRAQHPEWFRQRPDGTLKYAENPPKKYQDIYPFDLRVARMGGALAGAARRGPVLGRAGRADLPRRQSAHETLCVLGVDDRGPASTRSRT